MNFDLGDDIVEAFRYKWDRREGLNWEIGDDLVALISETEYLGDGEESVRNYILNKLAKKLGAHKGTLNNLERTARYWPPQKRDKYELSFSHFKEAGKDEKLLIWAWENEKSVRDMQRRKAERELGLPAGVYTFRQIEKALLKALMVPMSNERRDKLSELLRVLVEDIGETDDE